MTPATLLVESTKSIIRQSSFPVSGDRRMPRPISNWKLDLTHEGVQGAILTHHLGKHIAGARWTRNNNAVDVGNIRALGQDSLSYCEISGDNGTRIGHTTIDQDWELPLPEAADKGCSLRGRCSGIDISRVDSGSAEGVREIANMSQVNAEYKCRPSCCCMECRR